MSLRQLSWVWKMEDISAIPKLILLLVADNCDQEGNAWLSAAKLEQFTLCSAREIDNALEQLRIRQIEVEAVNDGFSFRIPVQDDLPTQQPNYITPARDYRPCYLYIITSGTRTKIGMSENTDNRLSALRGAAPVEMNLFWKKQGSLYFVRAVERAAHRSLSRYRWGGEWFNIKPQKAKQVVMKLWDEIPLRPRPGHLND